MKRKLLCSFLSLFLVLSPTIFAPKAQAATCSARADSVKQSEGKSIPVPADSSDKSIAIEMNTTGISGKVSILFLAPGQSGDGRELFLSDRDRLAEFEPDASGKIVIPIVTNKNNNFFFSGPPEKDFFNSGDYTVFVVPPGDNNKNHAFPGCTPTITVADAGGGPDRYCSIELFADNDYTFPDTTVRFRVKEFDPLGSLDSVHRVVLRNNLGQRWNHDDQRYTTRFLLNDGVTIPEQLSTADYYIEVWEKMNPNMLDEGKSCTSNLIKIRTDDEGGGSAGCIKDSECADNDLKKYCIPDETGGNLHCDKYPESSISNPCQPKSGKAVPSSCKTAIGRIAIDPGGFMKSVLILVLSLGGGILLVFLIINGYKLMISQGDPEKIKEARESIVSAVAGLLFIIFSIAILQLITVDILGLPGFSP